MTTRCRISGEPLTPLVDFGELYVSNFFDEVTPDAPKFPLRLGIGAGSGLLQLLDSIPQDLLYRQYWYRSGTNATMTRQLRDIVEIVPRWVELRDGDHVLDIGCNDGTLLRQYPADVAVRKVGIDPAVNIAEVGRQACDLHANDYFTKESYLALTGGVKAKVITSIAMFYDLPDPHRFIADIVDCLDERGVWILQLSYTPLMLRQNAFDNIVSEHLEYYSLMSIDRLFRDHGLKVMSVEFNDTNAGSFRLVVAHGDGRALDAAQFDRDIGDYQYRATLCYEDQSGINRPEAVLEFKARVDALKAQTLDLLASLKNQGKKVFGYGASTKGNTLLQYYGIDSSLITAIAERQTQKAGKLTVGSWIPIISEEEMRAARPDYLFILPWHFVHEFRRREREFLAGGGRFIVPLPDLQVIG
jgi:NDP-4-keto-2,6-dideoxyhexose 3-C-methyltransferase